MELGVSGYKVSADDRDQLQELKACALRNEFDVLLVFMFDRLGRRDDETPFVLRWFYDNGIEVWSVKEGQQVFDSYVDDLMNYIRFWTAKTESIKIALRVRTRLRQMVEEGKYIGGNVPFGYRLVPSGELNKYGSMLKKLEIVFEEAEIVRFIFEKTTVEGVGSHIMASMIYVSFSVSFYRQEYNQTILYINCSCFELYYKNRIVRRNHAKKYKSLLSLL